MLPRLYVPVPLLEPLITNFLITCISIDSPVDCQKQWNTVNTYRYRYRNRTRTSLKSIGIGYGNLYYVYCRKKIIILNLLITTFVAKSHVIVKFQTDRMRIESLTDKILNITSQPNRRLNSQHERKNVDLVRFFDTENIA